MRGEAIRGTGGGKDVKERQEKIKRAVEEEEKRAREMKQREVGRGHEMRAEDGHKEERG